MLLHLLTEYLDPVVNKGLLQVRIFPSELWKLNLLKSLDDHVVFFFFLWYQLRPSVDCQSEPRNWAKNSRSFSMFTSEYQEKTTRYPQTFSPILVVAGGIEHASYGLFKLFLVESRYTRTIVRDFRYGFARHSSEHASLD